MKPSVTIPEDTKDVEANNSHFVHFEVSTADIEMNVQFYLNEVYCERATTFAAFNMVT